MWNQRSVDTFLGLPFNIASYGLLLEIIAKEVNMVPEDLIGNLGDVHLYKNHIEQAKEQISREPYDLPTIQITERNWYMHEKVKEHLGPKTFKALTDYSYDTKDGLTKEMYDKIIEACHAPTVTGSTTGDTTTVTGTTTGSTATITGTTTTSPNAPITPPETPENAQFSIKRLKELLASKNLKKTRKGIIVKWKGPELGGDDYFILNKYLTDNGYIQKTQRETGDRDDEDITMKYKWKKEEPTTEV